MHPIASMGFPGCISVMSAPAAMATKEKSPAATNVRRSRVSTYCSFLSFAPNHAPCQYRDHSSRHKNRSQRHLNDCVGPGNCQSDSNSPDGQSQHAHRSEGPFFAVAAGHAPIQGPRIPNVKIVPRQKNMAPWLDFRSTLQQILRMHEVKDFLRATRKLSRKRPVRIASH
jgi:hypothetical protein